MRPWPMTVLVCVTNKIQVAADDPITPRSVATDLNVLCNFCELERDDLARGPDVAICASCLSRARKERASRDARWCWFCGNERRTIALENQESGCCICTTCIDIADGIIAEQRK